jgi:hypothetical protein
MRHSRHLPLALALAIVTLFFADVLFLGKAFYTRDIARIYVPERAALRTILRGGELPMWNPFVAAGQPMAANPEYEALYPPQWLCLLPDLLFGIHLEIVLHILFGAAGMAFLLTTLGARRTAPFGAICFALGGVTLSAINLLPILFPLAWWPWVFACLHRYLDAPTPRRFALSALTLGAVFAIGEPSTILQTVALAGAYAIARARLRGAALAIAAGAAALLVGAVQLVPALDHQRASGRAAALPFEMVSEWSLSPARIAELALPNAFGHFTRDAMFFWGADALHGLPWMFSWSLGLLPAALLIAAFARRMPGWRFVAGTAAVSYLVATGRHGPFFALLYRAGLTFIRFPEKWFIAGWFVLLVFACAAAERFLDDDAFRRATLFAAIALTVAAGISLTLSGRVPPEVVAEARTGALKTVLGAVALTLILALRGRLRLCVALLALFTVVDLGSRVTAVAPRIDRSYYDPPPLARSIPPCSRIFNEADWRLTLLPQPPTAPATRLARSREAMLPEMQELWGLGGVLELDVTRTNLQPTIDFTRLFLSAQVNRRNDRLPLLLRWAGATHVVTLDPLRAVPLPRNQRYWFADQLVTARGTAEAAPLLFADVPLSPRAAFIDAPSFAPAAGRVVRAGERANRIELDVEAAGRAALVVSVTPHKYWRATMDGAAAPLHLANVGFQALIVPAGRHRVVMTYRNPLVIWCGALSLISALALAAVALRSRGLPPPSPH